MTEGAITDERLRVGRKEACEQRGAVVRKRGHNRYREQQSCKSRTLNHHGHYRLVEMKVGLVSLGCPKNLVDSEVMLGLAQEAGHELTRDPEAADVLVVNTC